MNRIMAIHPDVVIVTGFQWYAFATGSETREQWWEKGQLLTALHLQAATPKLIYISDTPHVLRDIPTCLASSQLSSCDTSEPSFNNTPRDILAIDPTQWLCGTTCPAIVENTVAYRDGSHISVDFAKTLTSKMLIALQSLGARL